ncbi:Glutamine transport ATP-binding protein GlnQ [Legionella massiliensis]|uniref:Glutamine transport ATP-binding protein GlnQ n=1 Tax=Legionella massiliensis TaxID=1034943 RepID=A0A078KU67_9GAMM|nr:ATP-binding cassette domain-containing protein [Legionella massiliensis]CDZ77980.1 Glutamine transport ATP-binding protein GlnQ [Legionella massiliensis]CEE13718.1 Glutamine transport ATP-binding protein GlnQ [Legionella massiliensis]
MLTVEQACKTFGPVQVLKQLNLSVEANTIVGLAGPSGSGKSTLLRCIQGLESLESGAIHFSGKSGFMFQDFQLFPHMTVLQNLIYAPRLHNKTANHEEKAKQLLESLGIADKAQAYPHQLSGGQKQRVALARSLMMNPSLLLCDEPTSGLDLATIDDVISLLNGIKVMGVTMIIASHDLDFLSKVADRLIVLKGGELVSDSGAR